MKLAGLPWQLCEPLLASRDHGLMGRRARGVEGEQVKNHKQHRLQGVLREVGIWAGLGHGLRDGRARPSASFWKRLVERIQWSAPLAMLGTLLCTATPVRGQASEATEPPGYRDLIGEAVLEHGAGNFAEARSLFTKAFELYPNARALRGVGVAEFELRNYADSASALQRALSSEVEPLKGRLRRETEDLLRRAQGFISRLVLVLEPSDAAVSLDGTAVQLDPDSGLVLGVGDHTLGLSAPGYLSQRKAVKVIGGEQQVLRISLRPASPEVPASAPTQPAPVAALAPTAQAEVADGTLWESPWLWAGSGVVVATVAVLLAVSLSGSDAQQLAPVALDPVASVMGP